MVPVGARYEDVLVIIMELVFLIIGAVVLFLILIGLFNKMDDQEEKSSQPKTIYYKTDINDNKASSDFVSLKNVPNKYEKVKPKENSADKITEKEKTEIGYFHDNWNNYEEDYIGIYTPYEARKRLKEAREDGEWLDDEEYYGLIDVIASEKDDKYYDKIQSMTPEQTEKWFNHNYTYGIKMSTFIWKEVAKKLAPYHEQYLIDGMRHRTSKGIEGYVNARKNKGYFFSERAYRLANRIYSGEFDSSKKRKELLNLPIDEI